MKKQIWMMGLAGILFISGCTTAPITGRRQLKLIPDSTMIAQSVAGYQEVIDEGPLSENVQQSEMVKRVGARISAAVEQYFTEQGQPELLDGFAWEFNLIEKDEANAWCMPGGKVAFYTGILPFTQDETGLAVVMGHEIAHAVAGHSAERVTQQLLQQGGGLLLTKFTEDSENRDAIMAVYGLGSELGVILPYSRLHENEADRLGLIFMAMAGYDPQTAVTFWTRMSKSGSSKPPEFLSTHPSDETRIRKIQENLPEAQQYYHP